LSDCDLVLILKNTFDFDFDFDFEKKLLLEKRLFWFGVWTTTFWFGFSNNYFWKKKRLFDCFNYFFWDWILSFFLNNTLDWICDFLNNYFSWTITFLEQWTRIVVKTNLNRVRLLIFWLNNRYVVNLIYDQYIAKGSYKSVCEYLQSDERCTSIVRRDIWKKKSSNNNDDDNLIE